VSRNQVGKPHGDQVLKIPVDDIRALGILPRDIEVLGVIYPDASWVPETKNFVFLHIRCAYAFDRPEGQQLAIEKLYDFYERYISIGRDWAAKLENDLSLYLQTGFVR
jgi:hypothetical protein